MRMAEETYNDMNSLIGECFNANAIIDNLAYNLDFFYYNEIAKIVHLKVAHVMPEWADMISDKMLELSARPIRKDIGGYEKEYSDIVRIFDVLHATIVHLLAKTRDLISTSDMNGDDEVRIFSENLLEIISVYVKQTEEWVNAASVLSPHELNIHIKEYTHNISL